MHRLIRVHLYGGKFFFPAKSVHDWKDVFFKVAIVIVIFNSVNEGNTVEDDMSVDVSMVRMYRPDRFIPGLQIFTDKLFHDFSCLLHCRFSRFEGNDEMVSLLR